jgi:hypothetical protein
MKLNVGKPQASPLQRSDTGKYISHGTIAIHNDSAKVSCDVDLYGAEYDTKEEAVQNFLEETSRAFVIRWLGNAGAAQLCQ